MKFPHPVIWAICISTALPAAAEPAEILTYESMPSRIRHGNPTLAAANHRIGEALGRMKQSGRLPNPSFDTGISHNLQSAEGSIEIGLTQKFPLTNRLALEKEISIAEVEAAEAEVRDVERLLIAEARAEFVKVLSVRERRELLGKQKAFAEELASFISNASSRGEISSLDAASARLAALRLTTDERRLDAEETAALGKLRPLVGIAPATPIRLSGNIPQVVIPDISSVDRPDLTAARINAEAAGTAIALEQARRKDDIEASVFAAGERNEDAPDGLENEGIIGFRLSIPLPFWNNNQGAIDEAEARAKRKQEEVNALATNIRHESQTALTEMQQWAALISEIEDTLIPLATEQTDLLENAYRQGQGDLQTILTSREQTLALRASKLDAILEFQLARIRYEASCGGGL
ncbi:MAG: TolC family protein [Verrucomicrobiales bacterium]|nr:TolC family protein [Verrucomicrobiales bacterium]MDP4779931.1 TolC family protein [Akkermansiaceae bacterium]MDP4883358.1 TolC family protein [Opitutales bacterium]MDP4995757.1 TolC family protein [Akkermansiaceae bacterium]